MGVNIAAIISVKLMLNIKKVDGCDKIEERMITCIDLYISCISYYIYHDKIN